MKTETEHEIYGVTGRRYHDDKPEIVKDNLVYRSQSWVSEGRRVGEEYGRDAAMHVKIRFDDELRNGHQTFSITAAVTTPASRRRNDIVAGGCLHEEIAKIFPELAPLIHWHMMSTDGPLHYIANTVYLAGDRDHYGRRKGEPSSWDRVVYFADSPVSHKVGKKFSKFLESRLTENADGRLRLAKEDSGFSVAKVPHGDTDGAKYNTTFDPHFTFEGFDVKWHECPFKDEATANEWAYALNTVACEFKKIPVSYSIGKGRDLDGARAAACWPEATDEQLMAEPEELQRALEERLPKLMSDFRDAMEGIGMKWEPEQPENAPETPKL